MSINNKLAAEIHSRLSRRSSQDLQTIAQGGIQERWSAEAVLVARQILADRESGRATEPLEPEVDHEPDMSLELEQLSFDVFTTLTGFGVGRLLAHFHRPKPVGERLDNPVPFGPNMAWYAVSSIETAKVARVMQLRNATETKWHPGVEGAHGGSVFVTSPVGDWTLILGMPLFAKHDRWAEQIGSTLERLSREFGVAQYFANIKEIGLFAWAWGADGRVERGYAWLNSTQQVIWDYGNITEIETELGLLLQPGQAPAVRAVDSDATEHLSVEWLMQLAQSLSIDPLQINEEFAEPTAGYLGQL